MAFCGDKSASEWPQNERNFPVIQGSFSRAENVSFVQPDLVPVVGLEPTRMISPTDFESVTSANSITPANLLRFSAFFRFLEIGGHGGGQKSNCSIFGCQKIPKLGDFRVSERRTD